MSAGTGEQALLTVSYTTLGTFLAETVLTNWIDDLTNGWAQSLIVGVLASHVHTVSILGQPAPHLVVELHDRVRAQIIRILGQNHLEEHSSGIDMAMRSMLTLCAAGRWVGIYSGIMDSLHVPVVQVQVRERCVVWMVRQHASDP